MIDIHSHILPGVDDGPDSFEESIEMLRISMEDGVNGMVSTSHVMNKMTPELQKKYQDTFNQLQEMAREAGISMPLWLAAEVHIHSEYDINASLSTLAGNGKYMLIEFPMNEVPREAGDTFFHISLEGITPILAHPERYIRVLQKPKIVYEFVERGVLMQLNAGSITGRFGKPSRNLAFDMIDHNMAHFIASDCHGTRRRTPRLKEAHDVVQKIWGQDRARQLFQVNPYRAVLGETIDAGLPIPLNQKIKGVRKSKKRFILF